MKKQTPFNLASMPKLIISVTLIVMLGALFGATSYLARMPKIDLQIVNPIIKAQCEVNSDCELVYVGSDKCPPCDKARDDFECLNEDKAKKIRNNGDGSSVICAPCSNGFDKYNCGCENGKCEKIKTESREIILTTDKMEYGTREEIRLIVKNDSENSIWYLLDAHSISLNLFGYQNGEWVFVPILPFPPFSSEYIPQKFELESSESVSLEYVPIKHIDRVFLNFSKYKIGFDYRQNEESGRYIESFSNEFTIKEKLALDPRCGEEIRTFDKEGAGHVLVGHGIKFNLSEEKCIVVYAGRETWSVESPFETLEECQEVCEKKNIDISDWQIYQNEEFGFEVKYPKKEIDISINNDTYLSGVGIIFSSNSFRVITGLSHKGNISDYRYMDIPSQKIKKDGFQIYSLKNSSVPFVAFAKEFNDNIYIIEFQGDTELNFNEEKILSTFKFIEK